MMLNCVYYGRGACQMVYSFFLLHKCDSININLKKDALC